MATVVDRRRDTGKRFFSSRKRFIERNKKKVKEAIDKQIAGSGIKEIGKGGVDVSVPKDDISEPKFHHSKGGINRQVRPGNKQFNQGDKIPVPPGGGGGGGGDQPGEPGEPSQDGEGEDEFIFTLSEEEFLNYLFEDMELPNLKKKNAEDIKQTRPQRSGFVTEGPPNKLDLARSKRSQIARNAAAKKPKNRAIIEALKEQYSILSAYDPENQDSDDQDYFRSLKKQRLADVIEQLQEKVGALYEKFNAVMSDEDRTRYDELSEDIAAQDKKKSLVPKWNDMDLTYRNHEQVPTPTTKAAMFCLMDVSGSMDEHKKANAKLFYMLLYRFLKRNYKEVDIVFVRHTQVAEEVDEETFFYDQKTGGTQVSTALEKMQEVISDRYPIADWNIYGAQASDGENWAGDNEICIQLLNELMPQIQAYFYTEVKYPGRDFVHGESLWEAYEPLVGQHKDQFFMGKINEKKDIWPVFRDFFKKREDYGHGVSNTSSMSALTSAMRPMPQTSPLSFEIS